MPFESNSTPEFPRIQVICSAAKQNRKWDKCLAEAELLLSLFLFILLSAKKPSLLLVLHFMYAFPVCLFAASKRTNQRTEDIWRNCLCTILHFECRIAQNWWHHFLLPYTVYIVCMQCTQQHDNTQYIFLECFHMRGRKCYLSTKHFHQISGKFQMLVNHLLFSVSETLMCGAGSGLSDHWLTVTRSSSWLAQLSSLMLSMQLTLI